MYIDAFRLLCLTCECVSGVMPNHCTGASSWTLTSLPWSSAGLVRCTYGAWLWLACEWFLWIISSGMQCFEFISLVRLCSILKTRHLFWRTVLFCYFFGFQNAPSNHVSVKNWLHGCRWYLGAVYAINGYHWSVRASNMADLRLSELLSLVLIVTALYELE